MRFVAALILITPPAIFAGCEETKSVFDKVVQKADTHQSLYDSMLSCHEEVCRNLESIQSVEDAKTAEPRISAQAKKYHELANRFLLLGTLDPAEKKQLFDQFAERERQIGERERQVLGKLSAQNDPAIFAAMLARSEFIQTRHDFLAKFGVMETAKAFGKSARPADSVSIDQHEKVLASIATRLESITALVAAMTDSDSASRQVGPIKDGTSAIKADVEAYRALPRITDVPSQVRLEPAAKHMAEALRNYNQEAAAAKKRPGVLPHLLRLDMDLTRAMLQLTKPEVPQPGHVSLPVTARSESPGARKAREMMEAARARSGLPPPAQPTRPPRP